MKRIAIAFVALVACHRSSPCDAMDAVSRELCGPRKEWVGEWSSEDGSRHRWIKIGPHGGYQFGDATTHHHRQVDGDVVGFAGSDLRVRTTDDRAEELVVTIGEPPHQVDGRWQMTVMGATYTRTAP